jgi:hypothetical protein
VHFHFLFKNSQCKYSIISRKTLSNVLRNPDYETLFWKMKATRWFLLLITPRPRTQTQPIIQMNWFINNIAVRITSCIYQHLWHFTNTIELHFLSNHEWKAFCTYQIYISKIQFCDTTTQLRANIYTCASICEQIQATCLIIWISPADKLVEKMYIITTMSVCRIFPADIRRVAFMSTLSESWIFSIFMQVHNARLNENTSSRRHVGTYGQL